MGIYGLLSYVTANQKECADFVDLVQVARKQHGIELLCDFYAFLHLIENSFWRSLDKVTRNPWLRIVGAEYPSLNAYMSKFVSDLKSLDIHLVLFVDGNKGSSPIGTAQKMETWKQRHMQDLENVRLYHNLCAGQCRLEDMPRECRLRPVLLEVQIFETLHDQGCEVVQLVSGEADMVLVRELHRRPKAYAILSNDSDFCIFENSRFIPHRLFDIDYDFRLGSHQLVPAKPSRISCGVILAEKVRQFMQLPDHSAVIEMGIYLGNDFTGPLLHSKDGCTLRAGIPVKGDLKSAIDWARTHKCVEDDEAYLQEMNANPDLKEAVTQSREFYKLRMASDEILFTNPLSVYLRDAIEAGRMANLMGIHMRFYWHRLLLEDMTPGLTSIELALVPLRMFVYELMVDVTDDTVMEYGRTEHDDWKPLPVKVPKERTIVTADKVSPTRIGQNVHIFHSIIMHQEPDFPVKFFEICGIKQGFTCYVLRYFLRLNSSGNHLCLTLDEFLALVATTFSRHQASDYQNLCIAPNVRCVTIANWFQDVYRHAFHFCGTLLYLCNKFPQPYEIFSGSTFIAYYTAFMDREMPGKVPFHVVHSSGQDENCKASELNRHTPMTKGWQSNKFCVYPQDIVIQLEKRARVRKIQILSHQYLIPTKIEIYVGDVPSNSTNPSLNQARYTRLGYVALSNNEKTAFKARELKSVHVDAVGIYVKFIIHKNHINPHNHFNQVGLLAINVIGEEVISDDKPSKNNDNDIETTANRDRDRDPVDKSLAKDYFSPLDDLAFDMYQDPEVAVIIRRLEKQKQTAVLEERYDYAKKLKGVILELQKVGEKLGRYDVEKRQAVEAEDYDKAKIKKLQADEYRLQAYKELDLHDLLEAQGSTRHLQAIEDMPMRLPTPPRLSELPVRATPMIDRQSSPISYAGAGPRRQSYVPASAGAYSNAGPAYSYNPPPATVMSYDDRPLPTLKHMQAKQQREREAAEARERDTVLEGEDAQGAETARDTERANVIPTEGDDEENFAEDGGPVTATEPDGLNERDQRDAAVLIEEFGIQLATKAYAKQWTFREEAINEVMTALRELNASNQKDEVRNKMRAGVFLVSRMLRDQVFAIFTSALNLLRYLLTDFVATHKLVKHDIAYAVEKTLPVLLQRTGDTALRTRDAAKKFVLEAARFPDIRPTHLVTQECVRPFRLHIAPRLALSRTELVEQLYNEHGLDNSGLTVENMMLFCTQALQYTGGEVREKAEQIIIALYRAVGAPVRDYLPQDGDRNRKIPLYKHLFDAFYKIDGRTPYDAKRGSDAAKQQQIVDLQSQLQELKDLAAARDAANTTTTIEDTRQSKDTPRNNRVNKNLNRRKDQPKDDPATVSDKSCIFCGESNDSFDEKGLDIHYWKACPMLLRCEHCKQVVEIATYSDHLMTECAQKDLFQRCPRCSEAVLKTEYRSHNADKSGAHIAAEAGRGHCPLCHQNLSPGEDGWKIHLMGREGCKHNPRRIPALNRVSGGRGVGAGGRSNAGSRLPQKAKATPR